MILDITEKVMPVWGIRRVDPGYIYIIENHGRYKLGKTNSTQARLRSARTWLPDMALVAFKPFWGVSHHERQLHTGFASYWYAGGVVQLRRRRRGTRTSYRRVHRVHR
jgi:hypothetical protein